MKKPSPIIYTLGSLGIGVLLSLGCILNDPQLGTGVNGECDTYNYVPTCDGDKLTYCEPGNCYRSRCTESKIKTYTCKSGCELTSTESGQQAQCKGECNPNTYRPTCDPDGSIVSCVATPLVGGPTNVNNYIISKEQCYTGQCVEGADGARCTFVSDMSQDMPDMSGITDMNGDMNTGDMTQDMRDMAPTEDMTSPPDMSDMTSDMGGTADMGPTDMSTTDMSGTTDMTTDMQDMGGPKPPDM